jgi:hypothetical protein
MIPYFLGFAAICILLSFGLQRRTVWMWYAGWGLFYLFASYFGHWFFSALYFAETTEDFSFAALYLGGGLVLWMPAAIWWARNRARFGPKDKAAVGTSGSQSNGPNV